MSNSELVPNKTVGEISNVAFQIACPSHRDSLDFFQNVMFLAKVSGIDIIEAAFHNIPNSETPKYIQNSNNKAHKNEDVIKLIEHIRSSDNTNKIKSIQN